MTIDRPSSMRRLTYEHLFARIFAERTLATILLSNGGIILLGLVFDLFGFLKNAFSGRFALSLLLNMISLTVLVLMRLKLFTRKSSSLLSRLGLELFGASMLFSVIFMLNYFGLYNREGVEALFYPEGKYGPPLIREQFVGLIIFSLVSGIIGAVNLGWFSDSHVLSSQERLNVEEQVKLTFGRVTGMIPMLCGTILTIYLSLMAIYGPLMLRLLRIVLRQFISIRPTFHSFKSCIEPRMMYHMIWCTIGQVVVWEGVNLVVNLVFANSFRVSKRTSHPMITLLDGLHHSNHVLIQKQAIFELHQILFKDQTERQLLFTEFIEEKPVSREVAEWITNKLNNLSDGIKSDLDILLQLAEVLNERTDEVVTVIEPRRQTQAIFASKPESFFSTIAKKLLFCKPTPVEVPHIQESRVPTALLFKSNNMKRAVNVEEGKKMGRESWLSRHALSLSKNTAGKLVLGLSVQYYRARHVLEDETIGIWLIEALARLAVTSFDEDQLGQVQFCLDPLLTSILNIFFILIDLHSSPRLTEPSRVLEPPAITDQAEMAFHHILQACSAAIDEVEKVFRSAFEAKQGLLCRETQSKLERYHNLIDQCTEKSI